MPLAPRKFFWLGLVFVFLTGLFGGAFLVLRSTVTHGELANSSPLNQGKSSDDLLAELLKINQSEESQVGEYITPEDKNLTENFLNEFVGETGISENSLKKVSGSDFVASTVLPYLKSNQLDLLPFIPDSVVNIVSDSKANSQKYLKDSEPHVVDFFEAVRALTKIDPDSITQKETLDELARHQYFLAQAFSGLSRLEVPKKNLALHKDILVSVYSLQKILETVIASEADPLKALIAVNDLDQMGEVWKNTLLNYEQAFKIK